MIGVAGAFIAVVAVFVLVRGFTGGGVVGRVLDRAERMRREEREHELRLAEIEAEGRRPWSCTHCESENPADTSQCDGCGAPREETRT